MSGEHERHYPNEAGVAPLRCKICGGVIRNPSPTEMKEGTHGGSKSPTQRCMDVWSKSLRSVGPHTPTMKYRLRKLGKEETKRRIQNLNRRLRRRRQADGRNALLFAELVHDWNRLEPKERTLSYYISMWERKRYLKSTLDQKNYTNPIL